jgi:hypothetical protein
MSWMRTPLTAAVDALAGEATDHRPVAVSARTPGGVVPISLSGPLPAAMVRARENVEVKNAAPRAKLYGSAVLAGALALLALLTVVLTDSAALPVTLLIGAVIAAAVALATLRERRARRDQREADLANLETTVTEAEATAQDAEASRQASNADLLRSSEALRARLGSDQGWPGVSRLPVPSR